MASASIVRAAIPQDRDEIWRLFRLMYSETALFEMSERKVEYQLNRVLRPDLIAPEDTGARGFAGVIGSKGSLEGVIMLVLGSPWYSDVITMDDCVNFVDPDHRKSEHAKTLISYAKHMVDEIRKSHPDFKMVTGVLSTKRTAAKVRLYERLMTPIGAFFMYPAPKDALPIKNTFYRIG